MSTSPSHERGRGGPQKADSRGPSRTDLSGGEPVDPTASQSPKPPKVRGRGERKYYEGDEQKQDSFARQEVRQPPKDDPSVDANETLDWGQPREGESSTKASETSNWDDPMHESSVSANEPSDSAQSRDSFVTANETSDWTQTNDRASDTERPHRQGARTVNPTASSTAPTPHHGFLGSSTPQSKPHYPRSFQPQVLQNPRPSLSEVPVSDPAIAIAAPHLGQSGDSGFIRFSVMVSTPADLGDQREVVFVWPKEGYQNLRHRLGKVFDLDTEIGLAVKWSNDDPGFPERTYLDEANFEGAVALLGKRFGGDMIVVFSLDREHRKRNEVEGEGHRGRLYGW